MLTLQQCDATEGRCFLHDTGRYRIDTRQPTAKDGRYLYQFCEPGGDLVWLSAEPADIPDTGWMRVHTDDTGMEIDVE